MKRFAMLVTTCVMCIACGPTHAAAPPASTPATSTQTALHCRLPVAGYPAPLTKSQSESGASQPTLKGLGGFVDIPGGSFTPSSDSDRSYVASLGLWLPVQPEAISPDQTAYAEVRFASGPAQSASGASLYVVDVRTRNARLVYTAPDGGSALVLAWTSSGIYIEELSFGGPGGSLNLMLMDPTTGKQAQVTGATAPPGVLELVWLAISGNAAWGQEITMTGSQSNQQPAFNLVRLGLDNGQLTRWLAAPGAFLIGGFDAQGHPILVLVGQPGGGAGLSLVSAPDQAVSIKPQGGTYHPEPAGYLQGTVSDSHGAWFGSGDGGIWLYTSAGVFEKVATVPAQPGATGQLYDPRAARSIAGPCV